MLPPRFPLPPAGESAVGRVGASLADSLAAVRVALSLLDAGTPPPSREVIELAREATRKADLFRELLAALARAHCLPLPRGASDACTVIRRFLATGGGAGAGIACPGGEPLPVSLPVAVLRHLFREWWRGTRAVFRAPGPLLVRRVAGSVEVRARGRLLVSPEHLAVACGVRATPPLAAVPLPPEAWYLAVAGTLARRAGGEVVAGEDGPVLRLPAWPPGHPEVGREPEPGAPGRS